MKEINILIAKNFHNPIFADTIFFSPKSGLYDNYFLENRNLTTTKVPMPIQRYYLDLKAILNLKEFKIEIF